MRNWFTNHKRNPFLIRLRPNNLAEVITQMMAGTYCTVTITFKNGILTSPENEEHHILYIANLKRRMRHLFCNKKGNIMKDYLGLKILLIPEISTNNRIHYHGLMTHKNIEYGSYLGKIHNKLKTNGMCYGEVHKCVDDYDLREITNTFGPKQIIKNYKRNPRDVVKYLLKDYHINKIKLDVLYYDFSKEKMSVFTK